MLEEEAHGLHTVIGGPDGVAAGGAEADMGFLNSATLERWLEEFRQQGGGLPGSVRVVPQDGDGGADTGLVAATLASVPTVLYIEPTAVGSDQWRVTFEERSESTSLDPAALLGLAAELVLVSELCTFLQDRARDHVAPDLP